MAGYLVPPTKNPGDVLTSALWNSYIRDNLDFGMVRPIADSGILVGSAASIDFLSIPATFAGLRLVCYLRGDTAALTTAVNLRFNGDSAANYDSEYANMLAASSTSSEAFAQTSGYIGDCPANTAGANLFSGQALDILNYANVANNKNLLGLSHYKTGTTSGAIAAGIRTVAWRSNAAINRITVLPGAGNFVAGSRVILYGMGGI